ncbi:unnamed protein product [Acanthosepion pharaonis]|uniref:Uncharacterized protein n=1 Tax=Acanthosepion pharaonis TaxID=158019 RepID=A0A812CIX8_ACAPH|nr:unnamed protein product [Sepia pharaonis]
MSFFSSAVFSNRASISILVHSIIIRHVRKKKKCFKSILMLLQYSNVDCADTSPYPVHYLTQSRNVVTADTQSVTERGDSRHSVSHGTCDSRHSVSHGTSADTQSVTNVVTADTQSVTERGDRHSDTERGDSQSRNVVTADTQSVTERGDSRHSQNVEKQRVT